MDEEAKRAIALWRLGVLGPLISARLEHGDRQAYFRQAASRLHERPDGKLVRLGARTIESWFYAYRRGGFDALMPDTRRDRGQSRSIDAGLADLIVRAKREKPRRSIRRIIRMLERAGRVRPGELSRSGVHRLLQAQGISGRPKRGPDAERRSFLVEHAGDLWVGDAMHGPLVLAGGALRKSYLLSQIDGATRYLPHSYFALSEGAVAHEYGFKQALLKAGRPRAYYVDLGAAYRAGSLRLICAELGIRLLHTAPADCEAKGVIERFSSHVARGGWRRARGQGAHAGRAQQRALGVSGRRVSRARARHDAAHIPREHWLDEARHLRPLPPGKSLDEVFLHRDHRTVRKDGTVRFGGGFVEVRAELEGKRVELRFDPAASQALPKVYLEGRFICDTVRLDRYRNATRKRRRMLGEPDPAVEPTGLDPLALIARDHYERRGTIAPQPTWERERSRDDDKEH